MQHLMSVNTVLLYQSTFYTPPHSGGGVLWYLVGGPCVCSSICHNYVYPSIFSFPDDNLSIYFWIFTKLNMCIDIVEIWFGIAIGQISSIFDSVIFFRSQLIWIYIHCLQKQGLSGFSRTGVKVSQYLV